RRGKGDGQEPPGNCRRAHRRGAVRARSRPARGGAGAARARPGHAQGRRRHRRQPGGNAVRAGARAHGHARRSRAGGVAARPGALGLRVVREQAGPRPRGSGLCAVTSSCYALRVLRVGFVLKRDKPEAVAIVHELLPWLASRGCTVVVPEFYARAAPEATALPDEDIGPNIDILVCLGGDGTLLQGAGIIGDRPVPVLGINLGRLGFLAPFSPAEARTALEQALDGRLATEERMRLRMRLVPHAEGAPIVERLALNDVVISQGALARLL